jgi:Uncharacterized proteins, LmbE homologs
MGRFKNIIFKYSNPEVMAVFKLFVYELRRRCGRSAGFVRNVFVDTAVLNGPVLMISPHADDEVIGAGGALLKHFHKKDDVTILYLTDGRYDCPSLGMSVKEMITTRRSEAESIVSTYKARQVFWEAEDSKLCPNNKNILRMCNLLKEVRPKTIYLPSFFDAHYDHVAANAILSESIRQIPFSGINIMSYEVHDHIMFPNYILDITELFDRKMELLKSYTTPLKCYDYASLCKYRNALQYLKYINHLQGGYAEAYLRLSEEAYIDLFSRYLNELRSFNSNLRPLHTFGL